MCAAAVPLTLMQPYGYSITRPCKEEDMSLAGLANGAARAAPLARAVPLEEQEPIRADWRRILEPTRNWYYPGSKSEVNLGAAQVQMHNDALQPRHHHAMEQIRYVTAGSMSYGRNQKAQAGDLVY